jgi:uncharacterized glyoxalase superfamily protein PhnB
MHDVRTGTAARLEGLTALLPVRDLGTAVTFYVDGLGFTFAFGDRSGAPGYAGVERDAVSVHLQWQAEIEFKEGRAGPAMLRIRVDDIDALYQELMTRDVARPKQPPTETPWGTRELWLHDPDGHSLLFYTER